jgi:hypothetical protein
MKYGLRTLLLLAAVVLFVIALFSDANYADLLALGLAAMAASFVVDDLGIAIPGQRRTGV